VQHHCSLVVLGSGVALASVLEAVCRLSASGDKLLGACAAGS
jgi:hypothetical protein